MKMIYERKVAYKNGIRKYEAKKVLMGRCCRILYKNEGESKRGCKSGNGFCPFRIRLPEHAE
jgi:hypothetical protein